MLSSSSSSSFRYKGQRRDGVPHSVRHVVVDPVVQSIPDNAFSGCDSLALLELPLGLQSIGEYALAYCDSLLKLSIPTTVHTILEHAFDNCRSLREVKFAVGKSQLKRMGVEVFRSCHSLQAIEIPEGIKIISSGMFADCRSLTKVGLPSTVEVIEDDAFRECLSLFIIILGNRLVRIGAGAFYSCTSLVNLKIPSSCKTIEDCAFEACDHLLSIELSDGLNEIGHTVFAQCYSLLNVVVPQGTRWVSGDGDLHGCGQLSDHYESLERLQTRYHDLPIHEICYKQAHQPELASVERLKELVATAGDSSALTTTTTTNVVDELGMTPFHILAISAKPNVSLFSELLTVLPKHLLQATNAHGKTPLDLLQNNHAFGSVALIRLILDVTILNPSQFLVLDASRKDIQYVVQTSTYGMEQLSSRGRILYHIQTKYAKYERLENTSLLEQAIWKASLVRQSKRRAAAPDSRQEARVTSGAQVILPNVIQFLEKVRRH